MLDREKIVAVLKRRFRDAAAEEIATAANAIVGLEDEWEEIPRAQQIWGTDQPAPCSNACYLLQASLAGARFRVFRRRPRE